MCRVFAVWSGSCYHEPSRCECRRYVHVSRPQETDWWTHHGTRFHNTVSSMQDCLVRLNYFNLLISTFSGFTSAKGAAIHEFVRFTTLHVYRKRKQRLQSTQTVLVTHESDVKQRERTISLKSLYLFNLHLPRQCCIEASSLSEKLQNIAVTRLVGLVYINNFKTVYAEAVCCIIIAIANI